MATTASGYINCRGEQKVQRLRDAGVALPVDYAYTDSAVDLPLLRIARQRFLIAPSPRHLTSIQAALRDEVTILEPATASTLQPTKSSTSSSFNENRPSGDDSWT